MAKGNAKSIKKKSKRPMKTRFGLAMTPRIRLFLIICFLLSFALVSAIALGVKI